MAVTVDDVADLLITTQRFLGPNKWTDIAMALQKYVALPKLLRRDRVRFRTGTGEQWNIRHGTSGAAATTTLFAVEDYSRSDVLTTGFVPWRHLKTYYLIEEREEAVNSGPERLVEHIKVLRHDAMTDLAKLMETLWWSKPATSADVVTPWGVKMFLVYGTSTTGGFNGGNPAGYTGGYAGVNQSTFANWANWNGVYAAISKLDLLPMLREAYVKTNFMSPVPHPSYDTGDQYGYYTNYDVVAELESILETQNDNLGNDIAAKDGKVVFRGNKFTWVPHLDTDTQDPIFGINWGCVAPVFLKGEYMKEPAPIKAPLQPRTIVQNVYCTMNWVCYNRRENFVLNKAA